MSPWIVFVMAFTLCQTAAADISCAEIDDLRVEARKGFVDIRGAKITSSTWEGRPKYSFLSTLNLRGAECFIFHTDSDGKDGFQCYWIFADASIATVLARNTEIASSVRGCLNGPDLVERIEDHGHYEGQSFLVDEDTEFHVQPLGDKTPNQIMLTVIR
ncbi:MAG: hypothetical protein HOL61_13670 [Rhodospirillaceae bacterium]|nr:hypothetical protein [Rhodospirillaceae bacterium]